MSSSQSQWCRAKNYWIVTYPFLVIIHWLLYHQKCEILSTNTKQSCWRFLLGSFNSLILIDFHVMGVPGSLELNLLLILNINFKSNIEHGVFHPIKNNPLLVRTFNREHNWKQMRGVLCCEIPPRDVMSSITQFLWHCLPVWASAILQVCCFNGFLITELLFGSSDKCVSPFDFHHYIWCAVLLRLCCSGNEIKGDAQAAEVINTQASGYPGFAVGVLSVQRAKPVTWSAKTYLNFK